MNNDQIIIFIAKLVIMGMERYCQNAIITKDVIFYFSDIGMHEDKKYTGKDIYKYCDYNESELLEVILKCRATS